MVYASDVKNIRETSLAFRVSQILKRKAQAIKTREMIERAKQIREINARGSK